MVAYGGQGDEYDCDDRHALCYDTVAKYTSKIGGSWRKPQMVSEASFTAVATHKHRTPCISCLLHSQHI